MGICKILSAFIILIFCFISSPTRSETSLLDLKVSVVDMILLKYEIFLTKNFSRIYNAGGPQTMILYQYIDSTVKYTQQKGFLVNIYAYMDRNRYMNQKKYSPKKSDCNAVRNKIFLNKSGYNFFSQKKNNFINESALTEIIASRILGISGISMADKEKLINDTQIEIEIIHPDKFSSIKCGGKINQVELF